METILFQIKYFRKIHFGWAVTCFTKPLICSGLLLPEPGAVLHFPPPQVAHHTKNPSITSPRSNLLSAVFLPHSPPGLEGCVPDTSRVRPAYHKQTPQAEGLISGEWVL